MSFEVRCHCGNRFRADDDLAGRRARCKKCGAVLVLRSPRDAGGLDEPGTANLDGVDLFALAEIERTGMPIAERLPRPVPEAAGPVQEAPLQRPCPNCGQIISPFAVRCEFCGAAVSPTAGPGRKRVYTPPAGAVWLTRTNDAGWKIAGLWMAAQATACIGFLLTSWDQFPLAGPAQPATEPSGSEVLSVVAGSLALAACCLVIGLQLFLAWGLWYERTWARAVALGMMLLLPAALMIALSVLFKSDPRAQEAGVVVVLEASAPLVAGFALLLFRPNNWRVLLACLLLLLTFAVVLFGR